MISVCLIYSEERRTQATQVVEYLTTLPYSATYDLIQVCDGEPKHIFEQFRPVIVKRRSHDYFCRADLWNAGIETAKKRVVVILDCDRIAHPEFFNKAAALDRSHILYCPRLYQLRQDENLETIISYFKKPISQSFAKPDFRVVFDGGTIKPSKNPMSGCVAFIKEDYLSTSGLSPEFVGWGFNDTDYYAEAYFKGFYFDTLPYPEFHIYHGYEISRLKLLAMNAWNSIKFYDKWRLPIHPDLYHLYKIFNTTPQFIRQTTLSDFLEAVK
jgi:glycosyltransferase involved in cell wall biosynthesis